MSARTSASWGSSRTSPWTSKRGRSWPSSAQMCIRDRFCPAIEEDIYPYIDYENILHKGIKKEML